MSNVHAYNRISAIVKGEKETLKKCKEGNVMKLATRYRENSPITWILEGNSGS